MDHVHPRPKLQFLFENWDYSSRSWSDTERDGIVIVFKAGTTGLLFFFALRSANSPPFPSVNAYSRNLSTSLRELCACFNVHCRICKKKNNFFCPTRLCIGGRPDQYPTHTLLAYLFIDISYSTYKRDIEWESENRDETRVNRR